MLEVLGQPDVAPTAGLEHVYEWASRSTPPGTRFAPTKERDLEPVLRDLAARLPAASKGTVVIPEMRGPSGIPDLVAITRASKLSRRLATSLPALTNICDVRLLLAYRRNTKEGIDSLAAALSETPHAVGRRTRRLIRTGWLVKDHDRWVVDKAIEPLSRIYALEGKVDDWQAGMRQAAIYGSWADASAVVLLRLPKDTQRAVSTAEALGIGLAESNRWLVRPSIQKVPLARRIQAREFLVSALLGARLSR